MASNVQILQNYELPKKVGEFHRLVCLSGPKKGEVYVFLSDRVVMGRSDKVDIQVHDIKSSREHAEIKKVKNLFYLTDLGSQNGVLVNEKKVKQGRVKVGDKIIIGNTVYKFDFVKIDDLNKKVNELVELKKTELEEAARKEEEAEAEEVQGQGSKRKPLIIAAVVAMLFLLLSEEEEPKKRRSTANLRLQDINDDFTKQSSASKNNDEELEEKLSTIFHRGLREYREGNYFRALNEFNLALILSPNNGRAKFYQAKTEQALNEEIDMFFLRAKRAEEALKYRSSIVSYCSIVRLLSNYTDNERYEEAQEKIKEMEKILGLEEGEIKCTEE